MNRRTSAAVLALSLTFSGSILHAQSRSSFILAGYGSAVYEATNNDEFRNDFNASISPVLLYSMGGDFLFEAELEFGLSGERTTTTLEYAQLDYLALESVQIIAGKFLVPFGVFGERLHPTWINKLPTAPVVFGHAHGGVAENALLPILSDAGVMLRWTRGVGEVGALNFSGYVTQGPILAEEEGDDHTEAHAEAASASSSGDSDHAEDLPAPPVAFGVGFQDNNKNKMIGGRLGFVHGGSFEAYVSGFHAMYDEENFLDYKGAALSAEWRSRGLEIRGEGVLVQQEFEDEGTFETLDKNGLYIQASYRAGSWEPVVRWGRLGAPSVDGDDVADSHNEVAVGLDFWFDTTVPLKVAWEFHEDRDDQFAVEWAFGF